MASLTAPSVRPATALEGVLPIFVPDHSGILLSCGWLLCFCKYIIYNFHFQDGISRIFLNATADEHILPADGVLYYRGIDCREIVRGSEARGRFAFAEFF